MITPEIVADIPLFGCLPEPDRALIASRAADIHVGEGDWIVQEGETPAFFVLLSGTLDVVKTVGARERVVNTYTEGTYFGEVPLLLGSAAVASVRARDAARVMRMDPADFSTMILSNPEISADLLRTMAGRIEDIQQAVTETPVSLVRVVGRQADLACHDLRDFLFRNQIAFEWLDLDNPLTACRVEPELHDAPAFPVIVLPEGEPLYSPSFRDVANSLGLRTAPARPTYDLAIVGGGPAGLAAAVYGASEGLQTLLVEQIAPGGQAGTSSRIENYLGFPAGLTGDDLSQRAWQQASRFGADIVVAREVVELCLEPDRRAIRLDDGSEVGCKAVLLACGVSWRQLDAPGLSRLTGRGVFYGASRSEAIATSGKPIFLVGGGNSAGQAALYFADYAKSVTLLIRGESLDDSMSRYLIDELHDKSNIAIEPHTEVIEGRGRNDLDAIVTRNNQTGEERERPTDALFVFIGADARTDWLPRRLARDSRGYLLTGRDVPRTGDPVAAWPLEREPAYLETSVPGVFAAGDVRCGSVKRVAAGVGEGSMAVAFVHQYLADPTPPRPNSRGH